MRTVTFLFTDIEGSTALLRRLGDEAYGELLAAHHALIRSTLVAHGGTEVDTQGDAFFAVFDSPRACAAATMEMQQELAAHAWPGDEPIRVRMGIHTGEATKTGAGWIGLDVHRAARIAAVAHGGQVVLSESAAVLVRDNLPSLAVLTDLGLHRLKDLGHPERIFQMHAAGLRAEFPPLRSLGNPELLNNLPAELTPFIGRKRELRQVRALLESSRLVTLTGPGGSGKTRLGLQAAAELLDGSADGAWLVELAAVAHESAVATAISDALRIRGQPGDNALESLLDALAPQEFLIVLDNCEHLISGCAKIVDALLRSCPKVRVIATSREPLGISGETTYRVPSLSLPDSDESASLESCDAVALFAARARSQGIELPLDGAAGSVVASLCRRLDGLPLAIELAAARLRTMSLQELHGRLEQRFRLLTGGSRTALERQQTLHGAISWSYALLNHAEQSLLRRLAVFADGFDLRAAEAVCGFGNIDAFYIADLLGSLVDKSLVLAEQSGLMVRYRLLETIRQYAAEQLTESDGSAAVVNAAHLAHYLSVAEAAAPHLTGPDQASWLAVLDQDLANIERAASYATAEPDDTALVMRLGVALWRYWGASSRNGEAMLAPVLDRPDADRDPRLFCAALIAAMAPLVDIARARQFGVRALEVARSLGDDRLIIESLRELAYTHAIAGEPARGLPLAQDSLERARQLGEDLLLAESLAIYLLCSEEHGRAESERLYSEAIACTERAGNLGGVMALHLNAGMQAADAGDLVRGRCHLDEAMRVMRALGKPVPQVFLGLAFALRADGELRDSRAMYEEGLRVSRRNGDHMTMAYCHVGLACLAGDEADWLRSATLHGAGQSCLDRIGADWAFGVQSRQESIARVRDHMAGNLFDQAFAQGTRLSVNDAYHLAVGPR